MVKPIFFESIDQDLLAAIIEWCQRAAGNQRLCEGQRVILHKLFS